MDRLGLYLFMFVIVLVKLKLKKTDVKTTTYIKIFFIERVYVLPMFNK